MHPNMLKELGERLKVYGRVGIASNYITHRDAVKYAQEHGLWLKILFTSYEFRKEVEGYYFSLKQELDKNGLLPCPFCKSPASLIHCTDSAGSLGWYVSCTKCFCKLGYKQIWTDVSSGNFKTDEEAKTAWNQRQTI